MTRLHAPWLRPYLTVRDLPLWLALAGMLVMAVTGLVGSLADSRLAPTVVLVVGSCAFVILAGRVLVRRIRYARPWRVTLAILALLVLFPLLGALAFLLLPAALALLAVELVSAVPAGSRRSGSLPSRTDREEAPTDFDWPDDSRA